MADTIISFIRSLLLSHAPALLQNPIPFYLVAGFILLCLVLGFITKGREFVFVASSSVLFLIPFIKI